MQRLGISIFLLKKQLAFLNSLIFSFIIFAASAHGAAAPTDLNFKILTPSTHHYFVRQDAIASHISLRDGDRPRFIAAFPAGNSGVGVWFDKLQAAGDLEIIGDPQPLIRDVHHGVSMIMRSRAKEIVMRRVVLGSIRFLRFYEDDNWLPPELVITASRLKDKIRLQRKSFDEQNDYILEIRPLHGGSIELNEPGNTVSLKRAPDAQDFTFEVVALTSEIPLTPLPFSQLLRKSPQTPQAQNLANALAFLSYEEKLLAGSWRFLTYFGRDTLMSVYLLQQALGLAALEAALASVFERLSSEGQVAHEEDLGDWAAFQRRLRGGKASWPADKGPIYDYTMIDADFLLPLVVSTYLSDPEISSARAQTFFSRTTSSGLTFKEALLHNIRFVLNQAQPYSKNPEFRHLIRLKPGRAVGDWRDSHDGLGGGIYPFSVNVAFVPAALHAVEQIMRNPLLASPDAHNMAAQAQQMTTAWANTAGHFRVQRTQEEAQTAVQNYAHYLNLNLEPAQLPSHKLEFQALSLTDTGKTIDVMHSDVGFQLLLNEPAPQLLEQASARILDPFPLGLSTPVGIVVANPAFAQHTSTWQQFTPSHYHGTVVWSWQQAVYLRGLRRQIGRQDLSEELRRKLQEAATKLTQIVANAPSAGREELWTFRIEQGAIRYAPFGDDNKHHTESNPVQLWSTVFLGMQP